MKRGHSYGVTVRTFAIMVCRVRPTGAYSTQRENCSVQAGQKPALNPLKNNKTNKNKVKLGFAQSVEASCYSCAHSALSADTHLDP